MREIKFRGKSLYYNKWVYGFYLEQDIYNAGSKNTKRDLIEKNQELIVESSKYSSATPVKRDTIGQYTDLKDKNGKEIYEGDILEYKTREYLTDEIYCKNFVVKWNQKTASYILRNSETTLSLNYVYLTSEVIGNIYDNPELLEVE